MTDNTANGNNAPAANFDPHTSVKQLEDLEAIVPTIPEFTLGKRGYVEESVDAWAEGQKEYIRGLVSNLSQVIAYQNASAKQASAYRDQLAQVQPLIEKANQEAAHYKGEAEKMHSQALDLQEKLTEQINQTSAKDSEIAQLKASLQEAQANLATAKATPASVAGSASNVLSNVEIGLTKEDLLSLSDDAQVSALVRLATELALRHIAEAEAEAETIRNSARSSITTVEGEYENLVTLRNNTVSQLSNFYNQAIKLLNESLGEEAGEAPHTPASKPAPVAAKDTVTRKQTREAERLTEFAETPAPVEEKVAETPKAVEPAVVETPVEELPESSPSDIDAVLEELD